MCLLINNDGEREKKREKERDRDHMTTKTRAPKICLIADGQIVAPTNVIINSSCNYASPTTATSQARDQPVNLWFAW